jgi:hypothetical protein
MLWCRSTTSALQAMARSISTCLTFHRDVSNVVDTVNCMEDLTKEGCIGSNRGGIAGRSASTYVTMGAFYKCTDVWLLG